MLVSPSGLKKRRANNDAPEQIAAQQPANPLLAAFAPLKPRPQQLDAATKMARAIDEGFHVVAQLPTGMGKTAIGLALSRSVRCDVSGRAAIVTRTHEQGRNILAEAKKMGVRAMVRTGRRELCLVPEVAANEDPNLACSNKTAGFGGCSFHKNLDW
ncbi:unnamed protein product, partial [Amoebophrya sp. A25]|eukprot:GSA25T00022704001.1